MTTTSSGASSGPTTKWNCSARSAVSAWATWWTIPMTMIGSTAMITRRKPRPSNSRISRTVATPITASARAKAVVESTLIASFPVSWPRSPVPDRKAVVA